MRRWGVVAVTLIAAAAVWLLGAGLLGAVLVITSSAVAAAAHAPARREVVDRVRYVPGYHRNG